MDDSRLVWGALMPGMRDRDVDPWLERAIRNGVESVCLFADSIGTPQRTRASVAALRAVDASILVATDEEGGDVTRLETAVGSRLLSPLALGVIDDPEVTRASGRLLAELLVASGIDWTLAPVADVNVDPRNPVIGVRSFGGDAARAATHVAAYITGLQEAGVLTAAKHFPGHGDTHVDSHEALPVLNLHVDVLHERELLPFRAAIACGVTSIMTGHVLVPAVDPNAPATLSRAITTTLLRDELGYDGVIITDAIEMAAVSGVAREQLPAAAVDGLRAGADVICLGAADQERALFESVRAIQAALADGTLSVSALEESARRRAVLRNQRVATRPADTNDGDLLAACAPQSISLFGETTLAHGPVIVARVTPGPGHAAGPTTWGVAPFLIDAGRDVTVVEPDVLLSMPADTLVVLEVRDAWKRADLSALLIDLSERLSRVVVVDMGWPTDPIPGFRGWITTRGTGLLSSALAAAMLLGTDPVAAGREVLSSARLEDR